MDIEQQFNDLGVDAVVGTELMGLLGLNQYEMMDPIRFSRFQEVAQFLKNNPDKSFTINKLTAGKPVDKLDHLWGYAELQRQKAETEMNALKARQHLYSIDADNPLFIERYKEAEDSVRNSTERIATIIDQISYYER